MRLLGSLVPGVLDAKAEDAVRAYLRHAHTYLGLNKASSVLANVLLAARQGRVTGLRDVNLLPAADAGRRQRIVAEARAQVRSLPVAPLVHHLDGPEIEFFALRLLRFLQSEMSATGRLLFPELVETAPLEAASKTTRDQVIEQLGGDEVEVRYDGVVALADAVIGLFEMASLDGWLVEKRGWSPDAAECVLGAWLYQNVGDLNYLDALSRLRRATRELTSWRSRGVLGQNLAPASGDENE